MKNVIQSIKICFSMYCVLPIPKTEWKKENMQYIFCFFPLIGIILGGVEFAWYLIAKNYGISSLLYGAVGAVLPILISGGIHMDGLMDSCDATFSYGTKEKKLEILKDPHIGAFGVMSCMVYLLLTFGVYTQLFEYPHQVSFFFILFSLSRTLTGLLVIHGKSAKTSGLQALFSEHTKKRAVRVTLFMWLVLLSIGAVIMLTIVGGITVFILGMLTLGYYQWSVRHFGGITGDLVGFYLCITELLLLAGWVVGGVMYYS